MSIAYDLVVSILGRENVASHSKFDPGVGNFILGTLKCFEKKLQILELWGRMLQPRWRWGESAKIILFWFHTILRLIFQSLQICLIMDWVVDWRISFQHMGDLVCIKIWAGPGTYYFSCHIVIDFD